MSGQFGLLKEKRFAPFFITQFLGAFNDNLFKNALVVLLTFQAAQWTTLKPELLANLAAGVFILPFFLFSAAGDVFVFGCETAGLPAAIVDEFAPTQRLRLPMQTGQRSLNLSNAAAVAVFEAWRQVDFAGGS